MAVRRPYVRPFEPGWWRRNPYFVRYMARELTAPFVGLYALILLSGLVCLALGRAPYEAWVAILRTPASLVLHGVLVAIFAYHSFSWFAIMPKTMPPVSIGGHRIGAAAITLAGLVAAAFCMLATWFVVQAVA